MVLNLSSGKVGPQGKPILKLKGFKPASSSDGCVNRDLHTPSGSPHCGMGTTPAAQSVSLAEMFAGVRTRAEEEADDKRKARKQRVNEAVQGYKWLLFTFPSLFSKEHVKPLAIGVNAEIMRRARDFISLTIVKKALADYTGSVKYQQALSWPCAARYGLDGEIAGYVTDDERHYARLRLAARIGRKEPPIDMQSVGQADNR